MGHLLFHHAVAQTHTRALSYVLYLSLWLGVVWSDLHEDGLVSCWIASVALLPVVTALVLHRKVLSIYRPLLCLLCAGCFVERAASHTHHVSAVVVAVPLCI